MQEVCAERLLQRWWVWFIFPHASRLDTVKGTPTGSEERKVLVYVLGMVPFCRLRRDSLAFIGNFWKTCAFQKNVDKTMLSTTMKKSCIILVLFYSRLERFDSYVKRTLGRNVLLFINYCAAHGTSDRMLHLENIEVDLPPSNQTSRIQPSARESLPP